MSILRVGSTGKYAENWDSIFTKKRAKPKTTAKKKATTKKTAKKAKKR